MATKKVQFGPTQKDIARALGISQATVAYAMNPDGSPHRIPEGTVQRIHEKAREMGYRSQRFARILRKGRSHTIGAVFMMSHYHAPQERVSFLAQGAIRAGYQLIAVDLSWFCDDPEHLTLNIQAAQNYLVDQAVEGVIFCNIMRDPEGQWEAFLKERSLPAISLSSSIGGPIDQVYADVGSAYHEMTRHHLAQGSRTLELLIARSMLSERLGISRRPLLERIDGFTRAICEAGGHLTTSPGANDLLGDFTLPVGQKRKNGPVGTIRAISVREEGMDSFDVGFSDTATRLNAGEPLPRSILGSNDQMACGILSACQQGGLAVPGDVLISGMDDAPYARYCGVPITSISQPSRELTQWAIHRMVTLIDNPSEREHPQQKDFPCKLVIRQSTAPPTPS